MDLATAQANLTAAQEAYQAALKAKSYSFQTPNGMRMVTHHDLDALRKEVSHWESIVLSFSGNRKRKYALANFNNS